MVNLQDQTSIVTLCKQTTSFIEQLLDPVIVHYQSQAFSLNIPTEIEDGDTNDSQACRTSCANFTR